jgi:hypothetical protein
MNEPFSITPPPELVQQWVAEIWHEGTPVQVALSDEHIANCAAQWGADQELEACCEWLDRNSPVIGGFHLRIDRRPKPPSLKESALNALEHILRHSQTDHGANTIRRALEALPDD